MLRSKEFECISFYCGADGIRNTIERIGNSSLVQIKGEKSNNFDKESDNLEKIERKLDYLKKNINYTPEEEALGYKTFDASKKTFIEAELEISKYYDRLVFLNSSRKKGFKNECELERTLKMINVSKKFTSEFEESNDTTIINFDFITGIVEWDKKLLIKQILRHKLRKNVYIKSIDVTLKSNEAKYTVLILYALGDENKNLAKSIIKSLGGETLDYSTAESEMHSNVEESYKRVKRLNKNVVKQIHQIRDESRKNFLIWKYAINKEREMLEALKKLRKIENASCYIGEGWVLKSDLPKLEKMKSFDNERGRFFFERKKIEGEIPSHFDTSTFSTPFQNLTNVFGIPKYGEINPAIFMLFTFPFLFGAMFGDVLHGIILFLISVFMIKNFKRLDRRCGVFQTILDGRYVVLSCSAAAIWFGLLYGDFGSLPIELFKSQYEVDRTYPFGIDPIWHHADNKMLFINSLKMKLSLIIGFFHMGLGSLISIQNSLYFKDKVTLLCVALPQAIAFFLFLGYLVFLCFYKWLVTINHPSLVNTLITMYTDPLNMKNQMYPGQMYVQLFIFSMILICIPWMVFSKPLYLTFKKKVPSSGMLDLWITSGIHVVEFCLGLISNTSSYLRLWAVSLAHVQLTSVLHEFTLGNKNLWVKILTFPIYFCGTMMLLIGLEGLSSCLHALRLNWIEFFSKFYSGGGILFEPLNFKLKEE